jgi:hypothetical protein
LEDLQADKPACINQRTGSSFSFTGQTDRIGIRMFVLLESTQHAEFVPFFAICIFHPGFRDVGKYSETGETDDEMGGIFPRALGLPGLTW